jgi:hypothetical protein
MKLFIWRGHQVAVRIGRHYFGIRSIRMRELWSERGRIGWRVVYLPFGLRAFYRGER